MEKIRCEMDSLVTEAGIYCSEAANEGTADTRVEGRIRQRRTGRRLACNASIIYCLLPCLHYASPDAVCGGAV